MNLQSALQTTLENYLIESNREFTENWLAKFIRSDLANEINSIIDNDRYLVKGSAGQGNWAKVPWVGVFDRFITVTAKQGYYVVYLMKEDGTGIYLSLMQGVTTVREFYGAEAKDALRARSANFLAQLGRATDSYTNTEIDLNASPSTIAKFYESGSICAKFYPRNQIPDNSNLSEDLKDIMRLYFRLAINELSPTSSIDREDDEKALEFEEVRRFREHKRIDRNQSLAKRAKMIHGYKCQVCDLEFYKIYGKIGEDFIEAHHLVPLSDLQGQRVKLNPQTDFAVLCPNCHRMIHKSNYINDIKAFKEAHFTKHVAENY